MSDKNKQAVILTTGHRLDDERLLYTLTPVLKKSGLTVAILSTVSPVFFSSDSVTQLFVKPAENENKFAAIYRHLELIKPAVIVCCEVSALLPALKYKWIKNKHTLIVEDITEFYPENVVRKLKGPRKLLKSLLLNTLTLLTSGAAGLILYSEPGKVSFLRKILCSNSFHLPFYPSRHFISSNPVKESGKIRLFYSGNSSTERGLPVFLNAVRKICSHHASLQFEITLLGEISPGEFSNLIKGLVSLQNVNIIHSSRNSYLKYLEILAEQDIACDLRLKTPFFDKSLPIKTFDFITAGIPFVTTALKSLNQFPELNRCGLFVNPGNEKDILDALTDLIEDNQKRKEMSQNSIELARKKFNLELYEQPVIAHLKSILL